MCTVTFLPLDQNRFVFTNNRDEAPDRETRNPSIRELNGVATIFPTDKRAGGTWIGLSGLNRLVCILNGGFTFHERQPNYRKSRGVVVKELLVTNNIIKALKAYDFTDIEPFTLIVVDFKSDLRLFELVWDGNTEYFSELPIAPRIWSSSSLYSEAMKKERQDWFETFKQNKGLTPQNVLNFHHEAGKGNDNFGAIMDRVFVRTTSISQIEKFDDHLTWSYENLLTNDMSHYTFEIVSQVHG